MTDTAKIAVIGGSGLYKMAEISDKTTLDIERDPALQGLASSGFDIIVAANVLHATADLVQVMKHVRSLLAPGGVLLMIEGVSPEPWVDLTFGLTDGWWRFDDGVRRGYPRSGSIRQGIGCRAGAASRCR